MTSSERLGGANDHDCEWEVKGVGAGGAIDEPVVALQCMDCGKAKLSRFPYEEPNNEDDGVIYDGW